MIFQLSYTELSGKRRGFIDALGSTLTLMDMRRYGGYRDMERSIYHRLILRMWAGKDSQLTLKWILTGKAEPCKL
jgi:hypothetical protein